MNRPERKNRTLVMVPFEFRLRGSVLGMALIIALLIGLVSGFFVMRSHLSGMRELQYDVRKININNSMSGIELMLGYPELLPIGESLDYSLFNQGRDSVLLERTHWGVFEIIRSEAHLAHQTYMVHAMVGNSIPPKGSRTGLYLCDTDKQIGITGNSNLRGVSFVPDEGVKRAYIEGLNFQGERTIDGIEKKSKADLPSINDGLLESLSQQIKGRFDGIIESYEFYELNVDSLHKEFGDTTVLLNSSGEILISNSSLSGKIIVYSPMKVVIESSARLNDILVFAPQVQIEDGFNGVIQVFASESILIGNDVSLQYPSAIALVVVNEERTENSEIVLGDHVSVAGTVLAISGIDLKVQDIQFKSGENLQIMGEIYIDGMLDAQGSIVGSCYCKKVVAKSLSGYYENVIRNLKVDPDLLSESFAVSSLLGGQQRCVLSWL